MQIASLLSQALRLGASDLHLAAGQPPRLRLHGDLLALESPALQARDIDELLAPLMSAAQRQLRESGATLDFSSELPGLTRLRAHCFRQMRGPAATLRIVPGAVRSLDELQAGDVLRRLAMLSSGVVLVVGATGSGKSSTLAAMADHRNRHQDGHILTVEDPIEFIHTSRRCLVNQREVGLHCRDFAQALRAALRADPDVLVVGELRDAQTAQLALSAAETGHLVLATLHARGAMQAIGRLIEMCPPGFQGAARALLADSLRAVVAQTLCRRADGRGRVAALEILLAAPSISHLIRENKAAQIVSVMQSGSSQGMRTLDQALAALERQGVISAIEARRHARHPEIPA